MHPVAAALLLGVGWGALMAMFTGWGRYEEKVIWLLSGLVLFGPTTAYLIRRKVTRWDAEHVT